MHLRRARLAQHAGERELRGTPDDGVVDDHQALSGDVLPDRVELEPDAGGARLGCRRDERAADVAILHDAVPVGDAGRACESLRGGDAGLRHGHDHVGMDRSLAGELLAHALARRVHALAVQVGVGTREVDELEQAELRRRFGEVVRAQPGRVDGHHLARLDVAHVMRADDVERRALAGENPSARDAAQRERPEAVWVAHPDEAGVVHEDEGEAAFEARQHLLDPPAPGALEVSARSILRARRGGPARGRGRRSAGPRRPGRSRPSTTRRSRPNRS